MKIEKIRELWGSKIEFDNPNDFFSKGIDYWRNLIYERQFILFKNMKFSKQDYIKFCLHFGKMWEEQDYTYSTESKETLIINQKKFTLSPFSNLRARRLGNRDMPWHADIPNRSFKPFPFRSIWMTKNPNPNAGLTSWLNIDYGINFLPDELKDKIPDIKIIQQSWYKKGTDIGEFEFIKIHPVTGRKSLRLNFFCSAEENITDAWIKEIKVNGNLTSNIKPVLGLYTKYLSSIEELIYTHHWDLYDIIIYDNWSFVHNRTNLNLLPNQEREMYRANIDHLPEEEWKEYKIYLKEILHDF